ncbi:MAG: DotI/IcmL/TraM family protein [Alphaproteobacteria bacterium]
MIKAVSRFIFVFVFLSFFFSGISFAEDTAATENCNGQSHINLNAVNYKSQDDWEVWINDQKVTPKNLTLKEIVEVKVHDADNVSILWFDTCLNGTIKVKLKPGQTYWISQGVLIPNSAGKPAEPKAAPTFVKLPHPAADAPLSQLGMDKKDLILWTEIAASETMTFSFLDYIEAFERVKGKYFTEDGFKTFSEYLLKSGLLNGVINYQQLVTSFARSSPENVRGKENLPETSIVAPHESNGRYTADMEITLIITVRAGSKKITKWLKLLLTVQRVSPEENANGIAIIDWKVK